MSTDGALTSADYEWRVEVRGIETRPGDLGVALHRELSTEPTPAENMPRADSWPSLPLGSQLVILGPASNLLTLLTEFANTATPRAPTPVGGLRPLTIVLMTYVGPGVRQADTLVEDRLSALGSTGQGPDARGLRRALLSPDRQDRPAWSVPARAAIFGLAALLYTWDLSHVGMGNTFYAAAVKSGTENWKAFFFGSLDPGSFITVDKPPVALWIMELSGRVFGFSSWSMLLPEAVAGLVSVMVLYNLVRRWFGEPAAALSALALALTPVAVVIFRVNDPDALLTLLLVLAAWACWRAIETARTTWLVLSGALVGLAFLTKSLDAFIVVPALALAYLWCGTPRSGPAHRSARMGGPRSPRLERLVGGDRRCYGRRVLVRTSAGAPTNSELNLIFGYNGLSRLSGSGGIAAAGASGGPTAFGGGQGLLRMFDSELGGQISWLLPLAVVGLVGGLCLTRGRDRTDREWAGFVLWGGTLLMYFAVYERCTRHIPSVLHGR